MITDIDKFPPFKYRTTPYKHQDDAFILSRDREYYGFFWEMGLGKSKPVIDTAVHLFLRGEIDGVLIASDKGAYLSWYYDEIQKHIMDGIPFRKAFWSSYQRAEEKKQMEQVMAAQDNVLDFLCINIEALSSPRAFNEAKRFLENHYAMMVIDESTSIKNHKAQRSKAAYKLGPLTAYRRIMTGTPITQSPLDLYGQCEFLKPGSLGFKSFVPFRSFFSRMMTVQMGNRCFPKIIGYQNLDILSKTIQKFSDRKLKTECLDLPDKVYETVYIEHTPEQSRAYTELCDMAMLQFEQGLLTSTSALTTINKLMQINSGHVKLDDGVVVDFPNNRIPTLLGLLEDIPGKVIIWCNFQRDVELIIAALSENKDGYPVHYYGKTSGDERQAAINSFRNDPRCKWFVGTAATGGKGITLVEANTTIYYSNGYNLEDRLQSEDRNHRIGQKKTVTYLDFVTPKTVDARILKALKAKKDLASQVLDVFPQLLARDGDEGQEGFDPFIGLAQA